MNPSYANVPFKIRFPGITIFEDYMRFSYKFEYSNGRTERIMFYAASITDKFHNTYTTEDGIRFFSLDKLSETLETKFYFGTRRIFTSGAVINLFYLSDSGKKTEVTFRILDRSKCQLVDVSRYDMNYNEKDFYRNQLIADINKSYGNLFQVDVHSAYSNPGKNIASANNYRAADIPGLEKYRKALQTELLFLKNEGGRQYKVTNGRLISGTKGVFSYIFDLEAELHISDDAPINILANSQRSSGTVLMCEDFQIILQLESNIGDRVGSASITVEPWKLLQALDDRLQNGISVNGGNMAAKIMNEGPGLATNKPIDLIPKGQNAVIQKAMNEPVCIVWGPPGTGKTHTMSEMAIRFVNAGKTVLIVSHSNVSVDGVAKKIDELLKQKKQHDFLKAGKVLRYGYVRDEELNRNENVNSFFYAVKKNPVLNAKLDSLQTEYDEIKHTKGYGNQRIIEIRKEISKIRGDIREQEQRYVDNASIVATTISKVVIDKIFEERKFDVVMFDEVSMAYVLQVVCAATFAKEHLICVGDFMQLAPIALSKAKDILCEDIFSFLGINQNGKPYFHPWLVMLDEQRRMHPKISAFANQYVYNRLLRDHPTTRTSRQDIVAAEMFQQQAINLIDLTGSYCAASKNSDNSRFNILSALISFSIAVKTEQNVGNVSIITPYAAQTRLIRALELDYRKHGKTEIRCATVHQFQGSESDVILFDAVESYPAKKPGWLMGKDFNSILRLINVAVTRARGKLITVANTKFWENNYNGTSHTFYRLIKYLSDKGNIIRHAKDQSLDEVVKTLSIKGGPEFYLDPADYLNAFEEDIRKAKEKIIVSLPTGNLDPRYEEYIRKLFEMANLRGVQVLVKCNDYANLPDRWKKIAWGTDNATFPIIMIDDSITWYGVPLAQWKFTDGNSGYLTVCKIACRVKGKHTAEMIRSLSDLEYRETSGGRSPLILREESTLADPSGPAGLAAYIEETKKCPICRKSLKMTKGKSGKTILWCKECQKTSLLSPDDINHYMIVKHIKCPQHNCGMKANLGRYGLYIRCESGHYIKPEEI